MAYVEKHTILDYSNLYYLTDKKRDKPRIKTRVLSNLIVINETWKNIIYFNEYLLDKIQKSRHRSKYEIFHTQNAESMDSIYDETRINILHFEDYYYIFYECAHPLLDPIWIIRNDLLQAVQALSQKTNIINVTGKRINLVLNIEIPGLVILPEIKRYIIYLSMF